MYYYASRIPDLKVLTPETTDNGTPALSLFLKRESALASMTNAIERYCQEKGYEYMADWNHWKPQGYDQEGVLCLEEYYPDAVHDTYHDVSGYIYQVDAVPDTVKQEPAAGGLLVMEPVPVCGCEYIPDACEAIRAAADAGTIRLLRFEDMNENTKKIIASLVKSDYDHAADTPAYRSFLEDKFPYVQRGKG